jgi:hypothetical protein
MLRGRLVCQCTFRIGDVWLHEDSYSIRVWIGDDASIADRRSLDTLLAAIRPRH